eukprot:scaffold3307_cov371-Prasinococcus_capsulatus_cf.AAC.5
MDRASDSSSQLQVLRHCQPSIHPYAVRQRHRTMKVPANQCRCVAPGLLQARDVLIVTRFACIAQRLQSSKRCTMKSSVASCSAMSDSAVKRRGVFAGAKPCAISLTKRANGSFRIRTSTVLWYLRISRSATVPGLYRCLFGLACLP